MNPIIITVYILTITMLLIQSPRASQINGSVLFLTMSGYSRWFSNLHVARELLALGYNSTFVLPASKEYIATEISANVIISEGMTQFEEIIRNDIVNPSVHAGFSGKYNFTPLIKFTEFCPLVAGDKHLITELRRSHFNVAVIDAVSVDPCISVIPYRLSIPFVKMGRKFQVQNMQTLVHPMVYPVSSELDMTDKMSFLQGLINTILYLWISLGPDLFNTLDVVGTFATDAHHISNQQLEAKTALYLLDMDELMDYHLPTYPNMKYVGGLVTRPTKPLTGDLKAIVDSTVEGLVIVSFGSAIYAFPDYIVQKLFKFFQKHRSCTFVFRYGNETKFDRNVMLLPWLP